MTATLPLVFVMASPSGEMPRAQLEGATFGTSLAERDGRRPALARLLSEPVVPAP